MNWIKYTDDKNSWPKRCANYLVLLGGEILIFYFSTEYNSNSWFPISCYSNYDGIGNVVIDGIPEYWTEIPDMKLPEGYELIKGAR